MAVDIERNIDMMFKMTNLFFYGMTSFSQVAGTLLEYASPSDQAAKALKKYMKAGGQMDFVSCRPEYAKQMEEKLKDEGVIFLKTNSLSNGGVSLFVYADSDRKKVEEVTNEMRAEYGKSGITDHSTLFVYADGNVREIKGLDKEEAMLFAEHAEKQKIKIMVEEPLKEKFTISFAEKDTNTMNRIKADVAIALSGKAGKALRKQLQYENDRIVYLMDMAKNYDSKQESYLVDLQGNEMKIESDGITYTGDNGVITVQKNEPDFEERTDELILQMKGPVLLTQEQKEELGNEVDKKRYLVQAEHENGRPVYTEKEYAAVKEMLLKKEMYELKLAMYNPENTKFDICLENDDMRLATFEEYNDLNEEDAIDDSKIDLGLLNEIDSKYKSYVDTPNYMDYEIVDIQESVLDGREISDFDREAFELMHDKNNNFIPDEYEPGFRE